MTQELLSQFHKQGAFQLGEFTLKSGFLSPIYVDLRVLISSPKVLKATADKLCQQIQDAEFEFDYIVGVPYGAIMLATHISHTLNKPMLLKRKEAKNYGKKQMIEGIFLPGKRALIIEDVVTSGASIMETVDELRKVDLIVEHVFCVLNRQQGGEAHLRSEDIILQNAFTMSSILDYLESVKEINAERKSEIHKMLKNPSKAPTKVDVSDVEKDSTKNGDNLLKSTKEVCKEANHKTGLYCEGDNRLTGDSKIWSLKCREKHLATNPFNARLFEIMTSKNTNLCLALDFDQTDKILSLVEKVKDYICALKLHYDIIRDFNKEFCAKLRQLSYDHHFIVFEDRKFADIGRIMEMQLEIGLNPICDWADLVTVHSVSGPESISALQKAVKNDGSKLKSCLLIAELSSKGALTKLEGYSQATVKIGKESQGLVSGFICQKRCSDDPSYLYWTPGVNRTKSEDGQGQQWRSVEQAIITDECDILIVGRGIYEAPDPAAEAQRYARAGWEAFNAR